MTWDKIALFVPTYGRTHNHLPTFIQSVKDCTEDPAKVHFSFLVNQNDQLSKDFINAYDFGPFSWEMIEEGLPRPHLAKYYNMLFALTKTRDESGTVVSMVGDDMVFRTKGWEKRMLDMINEYKGIGVFWANDDYIARENLCVNLFVTRQFINMTERPFMCELFPGEMIDVVWDQVGRLTKTLHFDPDCHIWHNHSGKNPDATSLRLDPARKEGHRLGKKLARSYGAEIAEILKAKGIMGTSIC